MGVLKAQYKAAPGLWKSDRVGQILVVAKRLEGTVAAEGTMLPPLQAQACASSPAPAFVHQSPPRPSPMHSTNAVPGP